MRNVPSPSLFADAVCNKFGDRYRVAIIEDEKRHRGVCVERTNEDDTYTELFSMAAANGYYAIEDEGEYVWLVHPKDSTLQGMQSQYNDMWTEKYSAWEYVDVLPKERFEAPKQYE